jgi:hypothetical protein
MSTTERQVVEGMIDFWRKEIGWFTLDEAVILLRHLGGYEGDTILVQLQGYRHVAIRDLAHYFNGVEYCINIRPIYFHGGPVGGRRFKGTFLTFVLDRLLLVAHEKGADHALTLVKYARSFGTTDRKENSPHSIIYSG